MAEKSKLPGNVTNLQKHWENKLLRRSGMALKTNIRVQQRLLKSIGDPHGTFADGTARSEIKYFRSFEISRRTRKKQFLARHLFFRSKSFSPFVSGWTRKKHFRSKKQIPFEIVFCRSKCFSRSKCFCVCLGPDSQNNISVRKRSIVCFLRLKP